MENKLNDLIKRKYPRSSGVLLPITALHGKYGIGTLGECAREFIDFLSGAGFHIWQILPVEHTSVCFSPYKSVSAFAGEPMLIDPDMLRAMGLVTADELAARAEGMSFASVEYEIVREKQAELLRIAFSRLDGGPGEGLSQACAEPGAQREGLCSQREELNRLLALYNPIWLEGYALYMAIKGRYGGDPWYEWPDEGARAHDGETLRLLEKELADEIRFYKFEQWLFDMQWREMKEYAAKRGISIFGDLPIYVSEDSAEVWSRRELFYADTEGKFLRTGGAPPDYFTPDGQSWGNPVYNWEILEKEGYKWWIDRIREAIRRYDIIRLDHFRGFESFWSIPFGAETAREGEWVKGPGYPFFKAIVDELGELPVIAEDLGVIDEKVQALLADTGFRGMRVLQFGFFGDETHLPHNYSEDCVAYTGTHDNTTMLAWMFELNWEDREKALFYLGFMGDWTVGGPNCAINVAWIRALFMSSASVVFFPIQDLLGYGADTRMNTPGTAKGNWRFRIQDGVLGQIDSWFYKRMNIASDRDAPPVAKTSPDGEEFADS